MPHRPMKEAELKLRRAASLAKNEQHDTYNLAVVFVVPRAQLKRYIDGKLEA